MATNTQAEMHLTLPMNASNHYRVFLKADGAGAITLTFQKKLAGVKSDVSVTYDPANHEFVRLRHDGASTRVYIEAAAAVGGLPGGWQSPFPVGTNNWTTADVALTALKLELKAGTDRNEQNPPGTVAFDNVKVAK